MISCRTLTISPLCRLIHLVALFSIPARSIPLPAPNDSSTSPMASFKLPHATCVLAIASACAAAEPPTCLDSSLRMIFCAPATSPTSIIALT